MFVALMQLKAQCSQLNINLSFEGERITVLVQPKGKPGEGVPLTPLCLSGTPEEMEAEFVDAVAKFTNVRLSVIEQVEATNAVLEAARKESAGKAAQAIKKAGKPASQSADSSSDADDDEQQEVGSTSNVTSGTGDASANAGQSALNIFQF